MTDGRDRTAIRSLEAILQKEREVLLRGDLDRLGDLADKKTELIHNLNAQAGHKPQDLQSIRSDLMRNRALLNNAMAGIRDVADRLQALQKARAGLDVYDMDGALKHVGTQDKRRLEKRA